MSHTAGYKIRPTFRRQPSGPDGLVYLAIYTIEDADGVQGAPVTVAGVFGSAEQAMDAAREAGEKVLEQLH